MNNEEGTTSKQACETRPLVLVSDVLAAGPSLLPLTLSLIAGAAGLVRAIDHARIQKPGLALVGHFHGVVPTRVQILGETEISFLAALEPTKREEALRGFFSLGLSLVVITANDHSFLGDLCAEADAAQVPLVLSNERSSSTIAIVHAWLDEKLAPRTSRHGVLVDVFGQGVMLVGASGMGKSECALELVMRGHRLVADDIVECEWRPPGIVFGYPAPLLRHHIEVRGLGVLNINHLFGVTAVRARKRIDLLIHLVPWKEETEYDRMGVDDRYQEILGVRVREIMLPVQPGRSTASIIEVAARNELARGLGVHSAKEFFERLDRVAMGGKSDTPVPPPMMPGLTGELGE